jgi:hypothetical protein
VSAPAWTDLPSFIAHVRAACSRLGAPQPTLRILENEYVHRCVVLAEARAINEVEEHRERRARRRLRAVGE